MTTPTPEEPVELAEREAYEIGLRDGYSKAVQDIDQLTGGDGEYCYCMNAHDSERHCPDPEAMKRRIVERFEGARSSQEKGWKEERLIDDGGEEIFIRYLGDPTPERYTFIRDYLDFKLGRMKK